jgi:hypothetical protein
MNDNHIVYSRMFHIVVGVGSFLLTGLLADTEF